MNEKYICKIGILTVIGLAAVACNNDDNKDTTTATNTTNKPVVRTITSVNSASIMPTQTAIDAGIDISGRTSIVRYEDGSTSASIQVLGLLPGTSYGAHVHELPCALGGGGHYKDDPLETSVAGEENEIWLSFTTDATTGIGQAEVTKTFNARPEAQSVVVHNTDGSRIGCADLKNNFQGSTVHSGTMEKFSDHTAVGTAQLSRSNGSTYATLSVEGLASDTTYASHVHSLPCSVQSGGGHYKIDPTVTVTDEANELWLTLTTDSTGNGSSQLIVPAHVARPEAQSVVVHDTDGSRLACADLLAHDYEPDNMSHGNPITTAAGLVAGHDLHGSATMTRTSDGRTTVNVDVTGLAAAGTYGTHVHNQPCKVGGGGHYQMDPAVGAGEANEIWPTITANAAGVGSGSAEVTHTARAEAQAIVIHDSDGSRIGCFDLD